MLSMIRFTIIILLLATICPLSMAKVNDSAFDIFCFENAQYALIGEVIDLKDSVDAQGYEHWDSRVVSFKVIETLKGGPLPKHVSVLFERANHFPKDTAFKTGKKFALFLNPSLAYYYIPVLYGSAYDLTDSTAISFRNKIKETDLLLHADLPITQLNEYGFSSPAGLKINFQTSGGHSPYAFQKVEIDGNANVKCEIQEVGKENIDIINFRLSKEALKKVITLLARMNFYDITFQSEETYFDAPSHRISVNYGENSNIVSGFFETYTTELIEYYLSHLSSILNQFMEFGHTKINNKIDLAVEYEFPSQNQYSFREIKSFVEEGELRKNYQDIIGYKEKAKLIPYLISKLDFKDNTFWFQQEARVNIIRILRYLTKRATPYGDDYIYNSKDEEIQKIKSDWQKWFELNKRNE